jgi:hypothetical protein
VPSWVASGEVSAVTPVPTPTPTGPVRPERPAAMARVDGTGAAAAAEYFIELYGYVLQTGDLAEWDAMSVPRCEFCSSIREHVKSAHQQGESFEGGGITATLVSVQGLDDLVGGYPIDLRVIQAPTTRRNASGTALEAIDGSTDLMRFQTVYYNSGWSILDVSVFVEKP